MASASASASSLYVCASRPAGSDSDDDCLGYVTHDQLVEYHMKRLNNPPNITIVQFYHHFIRNKKDPMIEELERSMNAKIEQLNKLFSQYGEIVESKIITDLDTGEPMGYGFVSFKYQQWMFDAVKGLNGNKLGDDTITVYASKLRGSPGYKDIRDDQGRFHARPPGTKHDKEDVADKKDAADKEDASLLIV
ncbi:hypothetical protein RIF29_18670 [Crotalaria pallida]|uniref:RRM domain-containing protein n=1 Tax=Crotalaria pallida TaxID=3830 RepID=A0AAN9EZA5_CROPI